MKLWQRILSSVGIVLLCTMLMLTMLLALVRSARIQTAVVGVITEQLSRGLEASIRVDQLHYRFPNHLLVSHVLVEDQQTDTLLYVDTLTARMNFMKWVLQDTLTITQVSLHGGYINVYQIEKADPQLGLPPMYNYSFLVNAFKQDNRQHKPIGINLQVSNIELSSIVFHYCQWQGVLPQAQLQLHNLNRDWLDAEIRHLCLNATCHNTPLCISDLEARVCINDTLISFPKLQLKMPRTNLHVEQLEINQADAIRLAQTNDSLARSRVLAKTAISFRMENAVLCPYDLRALYPALSTMRSTWSMSAEIRGRIDSLEANRISLKFRQQQLLTGDATILHLPNRDSLYINAHCQDLAINAHTLQDILSNVSGKPVQLPPVVARLGNMHYRGALSGRLQKCALHGTLSTAAGAVRTDGYASADEDFSSLHFQGDVASKRLELGKILPEQELGTAAFRITLDGNIRQQVFDGKIDACVEKMQWRGYDYQNICFDGQLKKDRFCGNIHSDDPNIRFVFNGDVDFAHASPAFHFGLQLEHLRLGQLHLSDKYADSDLHFCCESNITGGKLDELDGHILLSDLAFDRSFDTLQLKRLLVEATPAGSGDQRPERAIRIYSDYINANVFGRFTFASLITSVEALATRCFPSVFPDKRRQQIVADAQSNHVDFYCYFSDLNRISEVLEIPVSVPDRPTVKGYLHDDEQDVNLRAVVPAIFLNSRLIENTALCLSTVKTTDGANQDNTPSRNEAPELQFQMQTTVHPSWVLSSQMMGVVQWNLSAHALNDSLLLALRWENDYQGGTREVPECQNCASTIVIPDTHNSGNVRVQTVFNRYRELPFISAHILPSEIMFADSLWWIDDARISYNMADTTIIVDNFRIGSEHQFLYANGVASTLESDSIHLQLQHINLDYILGAVTDLKKTIWFGGNISGWGTAYALMRKPMFEANVQMLDASINGAFIGDVYAQATLDSVTKHVLIRGDAYDPTLPFNPATAIDTLPSYHPENFDFSQRCGNIYRHVAHVDGDIGGPNKAWQLLIYPDSVNLGIVGYWTRSFLTNVGGRGSGKVRVWSRTLPSDLTPTTWVDVQARAFDGRVTVPFTGGQYWLNDSVFLDSLSISLPHLHLHDDDGNPVLLDGIITHDDDWKNIQFDIDVDAQNAIVIDIPTQGDQLYGGKVYGSGHVDITGCQQDIQIVANATTTGGHFDISLATADDAHDNTFIEFVTSKSSASSASGSKSSGSASGSGSGSSSGSAANANSRISIDLRIDVNPRVEASVLLNKQTGDCLTGRGDGNLRLTLSNSDVQMLGDITLQQGTFGFTFQNVIRRDFTIREGSLVRWSGPIADPELNISALYKVTASLRDLLGEEVLSVTNRTSVPVNTVLRLTDHLSNPIIRFGLELPSSDESVASQVFAAINTEEMMTRQVLYLLVFGRFYTPEYLQNDNAGVNETYSLISSTITGQINSWLGKLTNAVTLGFNFRTDGQGADASQEYEANFEIHPVRGLIINGNLGYRYNDIANQPVFGNLDVEYMLTADGKLRAKAYTHTVDKYSLRQANTIQGLGFIFKHDF